MIFFQDVIKKHSYFAVNVKIISLPQSKIMKQLLLGVVSFDLSEKIRKCTISIEIKFGDSYLPNGGHDGSKYCNISFPTYS